jgi:hypothetical protein
MASKPRVLPVLRLQMLLARGGSLIFDHAFHWPSAEAPVEEIAALVQSMRQLGRELASGELMSFRLDIPRGTDESEGVSPVDAACVMQGGIIGVLFYEVDPQLTPALVGSILSFSVNAFATAFPDKLIELAAVPPKQAAGVAKALREHATSDFAPSLLGGLREELGVALPAE